MKRPKDLFGHVVRATREDAIHAGIVQYLSMAAHPRTLWWHVPNGAMVKPSARMYFARLGLFAGMADLCFVLPDKTVAFLEIKNAAGRLSGAQERFQAHCALLGLKYRVVRSLDEAGEILKEWGAIRPGRVEATRPVDNFEPIGEAAERVVSRLARMRKRVA